MADDTNKGTASFISEMGVLKRVARTGWCSPATKPPNPWRSTPSASE